MTSRITIVLGTFLALVGSSHAQFREAASAPQFPTPEMVAPGPDGLSSSIVDDAAPNAAEQFWARGDYMLGWVRGMRLPPLVTTSPPGIGQADAGVLGTPGTSVLIGNNTVDGQVRSGGRINLGYYGSDLPLGVEAGFFMLAGDTHSDTVASIDGPILARPFIDANTGQNRAFGIAFPGLFDGGASVTATTHAFYGGNIDVSKRLINTDCCRLTVMLGYRYQQYGDALLMTEQSTLLGGLVPPGTMKVTSDAFSVRNEFNGAEVGGRFEWFLSDWSFEVLGKVAPGRNNREININGNTVTSVPGVASTATPGGILALATNSGTTFSNVEAVAAEFGATLGWNVTANLRLRLGWTLLYWSDVVRAGDQVDLVINPNLLSANPPAGPQRPAVLIHSTDFWAQAVTAGVQFCF